MQYADGVNDGGSTRQERDGGSTMHERIPSLDFETILQMLPAAPQTRRRKPPEPVLSDEESEKEEIAISWMMRRRTGPPPLGVYPENSSSLSYENSNPTSNEMIYSPPMIISKKNNTSCSIKNALHVSSIVTTINTVNSPGSSSSSSPSSDYASRRFPLSSKSTVVVPPHHSRRLYNKEQKKKKKPPPLKKQRSTKQHRGPFLEPRRDSSWAAAARSALKTLPEHKMSIVLTMGSLVLAYLIAAPPEPIVVKSTCVDTYPTSCVDYAATGACSQHPGWMLNYCASTCGECELRDPSNRCTRDYLNLTKEQPAFSTKPEDPNSLEQIFTAVLDNPRWKATALSRDPWLVQIDTFLEPWECDGLINANGLNFVRSTDTGDFDVKGGGFRKVRKQNFALTMLLFRWCRRPGLLRTRGASKTARIRAPQNPSTRKSPGSSAPAQSASSQALFFYSRYRCCLFLGTGRIFCWSVTASASGTGRTTTSWPRTARRRWPTSRGRASSRPTSSSQTSKPAERPRSRCST
jgi:hypothetical protein